VTAQLPAEPAKLFTTKKLVQELHHPHAVRRAAAADAARWLIALASDRVAFGEGTHAQVWSHIFDRERLQADIDLGDPRRRRRDPMRAAGARLALESLQRLLALRSSEGNVELEVPRLSNEDVERVVARLQVWIADPRAVKTAA
jgi:hypothetical protein